jgi:preprotein translocase subunit SecA
MTGTAYTEANEFFEIFLLKVLPIPTALPIGFLFFNYFFF